MRLNDALHSMRAVCAMMLGNPAGLRHLDISERGFWNSFQAIVVALPPLALSWLYFSGKAVEILAMPEARGHMFITYAIADIAVWIGPLIGLVIAAGPLGIRDRLVHYVVASNWTSAVLSWIVCVPVLISWLFPQSEAMMASVMVLLMLGLIFPAWRVAVIALGKGPVLGTGVFCAMFLASVVIMLGVERILQI